MKIAFRAAKLSKDNKVKLAVINEIIEEYQAQDYRLTLRQLYYQLVSRDIIPNSVSEYRKISVLLTEGRMAGIVDWDAIEDRLRRPDKPAAWNNAADIMDSVIYQFEKPRMAGQANYIETWVEKDALSGVLSRVTYKYHVPICVNRGYSSASAMFTAYERFMRAIKNDQPVTILYLGDYDPSGIDMIRDINDRILEFFKGSDEARIHFEYSVSTPNLLEDAEQLAIELGFENPSEGIIEAIAFSTWLTKMFRIVPIALTEDQIKKYNPPKNPAKLSDPRGAKYVAERGYSSWEVDALKPEVLNALLTKSIEDLLDMDMYRNIMSLEAYEKNRLRDAKKWLGDDKDPDDDDNDDEDDDYTDED